MGKPAMTDDATLLRRYAEDGSEEAFADLVRRYLDLVYSAALRRLGGDVHRAADVAQQVFTTLARDGAKLSHHAVLTAWLYTATRNAAIDVVRAEQRRHAREQEASMTDIFMSGTSDAEWAKLRPILDEVMDDLKETDRTAVLLRFFEQRSFADLGSVLKLSDDVARMRVDRALQKLHGLLARRDVDLDGVRIGEPGRRSGTGQSRGDCNVGCIRRHCTRRRCDRGGRRDYLYEHEQTGSESRGDRCRDWFRQRDL
jgi:RNA polymerase sigma factor (sigma-70 family)